MTSNDNHYGGMNLGGSENEHFHDNDSVDMAADMIAIQVVDTEEQLENLQSLPDHFIPENCDYMDIWQKSALFESLQADLEDSYLILQPSQQLFLFR